MGMDEQASVASQDDILSNKWFEARQHPFKMSYYNETAAAAAAPKTTKMLPL